MGDDGQTQMLRTLLPYIRRQTALISGSFLILLFASAIRLFEPWPLAFAIDIVMGDIAQNTLVNALDTASLRQETWLWLCAGGIVVIAALRAIAGYFSTLGMALAGSRVMSDIRRDLFAHLLRLPLSFHHASKTGDLTMRLINDIGMMREVVVTALMPLLSSLVIFAGMLAIMAFLDWQLMLIALLPMPVLAISTLRSSRKIHGVSRAQRKREGALAAKSAEFLAAIATIQAMSLERAATDSFNGNDAQSLKQNVQAKRLSAGLERWVDMLIAATVALVLLLGAKSVLSGKMSAGELIIFISYLKNAFRPVREFAKYTGRLSRALTAGERIVELLQIVPTGSSPSRNLPFMPQAQDIRFEQVSFAYRTAARRQRRDVLHKISFQLPAGQTLAVTGPSGAGKSTLSQLLLRLYDPCEGRILIGGRDLRDYEVNSLRQQVAWLPQESLLFGLSIRENIALGACNAVTDEEIMAAARLANAHHFISRLPEGYDTVVSERGVSLSGGQRQRIAIARMVVRQAAFLLLDEPGTGLDRKNEREVADALVRLMKGKTGLIVTHNLAFAARADQILLLDNGRIIEQGSHQTLLAKQGRYFELWNMQR